MISVNSRRVVLTGLVVVLVLFAEEGWHLQRWDRKGEEDLVPAEKASLLCTPRAETPDYKWCNVPGFGPALYRCVQRMCYYQEPSAVLRPVRETQKEDAEMARMFAQDKGSE